MKKWMKKLAAALMAMSILASMSVSVFAEDEAPEQVQEVENVTETAPEIHEEAPAEEPVETEESEAESEEAPVAFTGTVEIELKNSGDLYFGDTVTLRAVVRDANAEYAIRWEYFDGSEWKEIKDEHKDEYKFIVTEDNAEYEYRVVLITEA